MTSEPRSAVEVARLLIAHHADGVQTKEDAQRADEVARAYLAMVAENKRLREELVLALDNIEGIHNQNDLPSMVIVRSGRELLEPSK
jgi:hypothetical protein